MNRRGLSSVPVCTYFYVARLQIIDLMTKPYKKYFKLIYFDVNLASFRPTRVKDTTNLSIIF